MIRFGILALAVVTHSASVRAGVIPAYEISLSHTSYLGTVTDSKTGNFSLLGDAQVGFFADVNTTVPIAGGNFTNYGSASMSGFIRGHNLGLGLTLSDGPHDSGQRLQLDAVFRGSDPFSLIARSNQSILPDYALVGYFTVQFSASMDLGQSPGKDHGNPLSYSIFTGVDASTFTLDDDFLFFDSGVKNVNTSFGVNFTNPGEQSGSYSFEFRTSFWIADDRAHIDGTKTFTLESLRFTDGTSPEDHGFDIVFQSGRTSPNLVLSVPEPSSITLWSIGLAGVYMGYRRRRREDDCGGALRPIAR